MNGKLFCTNSYQYPFPTVMYGSSLCTSSWPTLAVFCRFNFSHSVRFVFLWLLFAFPWWIMRDNTCFWCVCGYLGIFLCEVLVYSFAQFSTGCICVFLKNVSAGKKCIYIQGISPLSIMWLQMSSSFWLAFSFSNDAFWLTYQSFLHSSCFWCSICVSKHKLHLET